MEKSREASPEKPDEQTQENGIENDKDEETRSKVEPILVGRSDNCNDEITSQPVEDATRAGGSNGEETCSLSPDEIKQIVANILATISADSSIKGPSGSGKLMPCSDNIFRTPNGKEPANNGSIEFSPGKSSKYKSRFSSFSSGNKKKASAKLTKSKSSRSNSWKNKTLHSGGGSGTPEPNTNAEKSNLAAHASSSKERRRKNKKQFRENAHDVFTKMRKQVRYILNKIKYEQSLIDAYGGEGWKGMSIDKLKPEKELQRASSEIVRCKLRLRDLFQRLDALCAEGAYPKSMFDSEGLLDSEDIYCTICGSKEVSADNDIVLCDGECNRAFHQLCLKPPLLTEEIPPEDQGWLCPGCDCKFDCTELLNDFFGSDLSMKDSWTSVFPEAAAAGSNIVDEILRLPSDDSEDDDFNPDDVDVTEKVEIDGSEEGGESCEGEESASDDSDFSSASEDLGDFINKGLLVGNPTGNLEEEDDDDDDDYDPDVPDTDNMDVDEKVEIEKSGDRGEPSEGQESASDESDFSSASEDLRGFMSKQLVGNPLDNSEDEDDDYDPDVPEPNQQNEEIPCPDFTSDSHCTAVLHNIMPTINEDSELVALETEQKSHVPGSKKRDIERLDYKKLYDETYGNASSDSSDDEDWSEVGPSRKRKDKIKKDGSTIPKNNKRGSEDDKQPMNAERKLQEAEYSTPRRSGKKLKSSSGNGSMEKGSYKGSYKTLGETATQKLNEAFQKNHYPERAVKECLAKDLGLSYQKVDKWFGNARWSFNHPVHAKTVSKSNIASKSPAQTKPGSKVAVLDNSSNNHSSQNLPEAKTTTSDTPVKISSPLKTTSASSEGKRGQGNKFCSPNSSAKDKTIHGDGRKTPWQPNKRRSARLEESCTTNGSRVEVNKESTDKPERGSANAGESSRQNGNTPTRKAIQRGKKAPPKAKQ